MKKSIELKLKSRPYVIILATLCCALWGSAFPAIKTGYRLLDIASADYSSQILFAGVRFTLAGIFTLIIGSVMSRRILFLKGKGIGKASVLAVFQTVLQYIFFYIALAHTSGTNGSIINSVSVFFSVIIASVFMKQERLSIIKLIGCVIGFAGVVLINLSGTGVDGSFNVLGEGFMVLSALSYAVSSVLIKCFSASENPVALSGSQFVLGGIVMTAIGLLMGGTLRITHISAVTVIAYLALLSAIAYTLWGILLKYNEVSSVTIFGFMTPVFGCILSAIMLGEGLGNSVVKTITSLLLVCIGIFIVNMKSLNKSEKNYEG